MKIIGYKGLSRKDIGEGTGEKGLGYLLRQIKKENYFFIKRSKREKIGCVLAKLHLLEREIRVDILLPDMQILIVSCI